MKRIWFFMGVVLFALGVLLVAAPGQAQYTITNGSMIQGSTDVPGWSDGGYNCSVAYQAINSPSDSESLSGSVVVTAGSSLCSLTQVLGITASGQTLSIYADIAWDGDWDYIYFGFYEENTWDRIDGASVDIAPLVPADTDGTLNNFVTVEATGTLPNTGNPVRVFVGSSCSPYSGGAKTVWTSKFAVDNVRENLSVMNWSEY